MVKPKTIITTKAGMLSKQREHTVAVECLKNVIPKLVKKFLRPRNQSPLKYQWKKDRKISFINLIIKLVQFTERWGREA